MVLVSLYNYNSTFDAVQTVADRQFKHFFTVLV